MVYDEFLADRIRGTQTTLIVPDYPLAPEQTAREALFRRFESSGQAMNNFVFPGLFHDWPILGSFIGESRNVFSTIKNKIQLVSLG